MKYLAFLVYDCGCLNDANYSFTKRIKIYAPDKGELEKRLEQLKKRKPRSNEGHQCVRKREPVEILVVDSNFDLVSEWKRT